MRIANEATTIAIWIKANTKLDSRSHHARLKKAWRDAPPTARVPDAPPLGGKLLDRVREALAELETGASRAPMMGDASDPALAPPAEDGIPAAEVERLLAEARNVAADVDDWGGSPCCPDCAGTGKYAAAGNYCRCPLGPRRQLEDRASHDTTNQAGEEPATISDPEGGDEENDVTKMTTMKKSDAEVKKTKPSGTEPVPHDHEARRELEKRYPKIKEILEWSDSTGRPGRVKIACQWKHPGCEKTRDIFVQDLFQVHGCRPCAKVNLKIHRSEAAKPKKAKK